MQLVVDSSVILAACLAGGRLGRLEGHELHAPAHLPGEVTSTLRERAFRTEVSPEVAVQALERLSSLPIQYAPPGSLAREAYELAAARRWARTYDAEYVALARRLDCSLVTLDRRLQRGAAGLATVIGPTDLPETR